jgi:hypothetical protein
MRKIKPINQGGIEYGTQELTKKKGHPRQAFKEESPNDRSR